VARKRTNPFNVALGVVGILFTITAMSYCVFVLRGVQSAAGNAAAPPAAFEQLMDGYGTTILVVQLIALAVATVGAVAFDDAEGRRELARRQEASKANADRPAPASHAASAEAPPS
jgi:flagellar basal body-associated protein FliL